IARKRAVGEDIKASRAVSARTAVSAIPTWIHHYKIEVGSARSPLAAGRCIRGKGAFGCRDKATSARVYRRSKTLAPKPATPGFEEVCGIYSRPPAALARL